MPDKYEFRRYADNLTHPWFNDVKLDFRQLWLSPNKLLLCILCVILMNIDQFTFFDQQQEDLTYNNNNDNNNDEHNSNNNPLPSDGVTLYHDRACIISNNKSHHKQCKQQKFDFSAYLGSKKKNMFHTQLMIGVLFGFMMKCRIPILFSFINIILKSGCSFKPKIIPMFIDNKTLKPQTFYGSSYKLLDNNERMSLDLLHIVDHQNISDDDSDDSSSSDEDDDEEEDEDIDFDYNFINNELPKHLFGDF